MKKIGEGREAEMFAWDGDRILRLYRPDFLRPKAEYQIRALKAAREAGVRVPEVFDTVEVNGRFGVVMERIDGIDLLSLLGKKPWRIRWVGAVVGRAQAEINRAIGPDTVPQLIRRYRYILERIKNVPSHYAESAIARLDRLPEGDRLLHGDFHPGNVMMHGDRPVIVDWSNAARGSPEADLARTRLLMELAEPPPGTPKVVRVAALFARALLADAHVRAYREALAPDEALLRSWELPVAVFRLAEGFPAERKRLMQFIDRRLTD